MQHLSFSDSFHVAEHPQDSHMLSQMARLASDGGGLLHRVHTSPAHIASIQSSARGTPSPPHRGHGQ